jgi:hypothetical protein
MLSAIEYQHWLMPTTPSSLRLATTSAASSDGSGFYCASSWPRSLLRQMPGQRENSILHRRPKNLTDRGAKKFDFDRLGLTLPR